ncbi:hypothetical protein BRD19_04130 [Halobacteriales archaeon SW_7_65_23]|nr:MAG: hypothetical protein BRD19_04130 [Halobacteriales archaeon SW_7_65_23]
MRAINDRKATLGITESSPARAHIDRVACYLDVGSLHPARGTTVGGHWCTGRSRERCRAATPHGVTAERI